MNNHLSNANLLSQFTGGSVCPQVNVTSSISNCNGQTDRRKSIDVSGEILHDILDLCVRRANSSNHPLAEHIDVMGLSLAENNWQKYSLHLLINGRAFLLNNG